MLPNSIGDCYHAINLDDKSFIDWCLNNNFLKSFQCPKCQSDMKLIHEEKNSDSYLWRCMSCKKRVQSEGIQCSKILSFP